MPSRGPYAKGVAKREEILSIALEHFTRKGYDRVSVREIARDAGVSQAGLLHHFSTKEDLFLEVLKWRHVRDADRFEPGTPAVDALIGAADHNAREPGLVRLYVLLSAESTNAPGPARSFFEERYHVVLDAITADIARRQDAGEVSDRRDPRDLASLLVAAADGLQLQWLLHPDEVDMHQRLRLLWDAVLGRSSEDTPDGD